MHMGCEKENRSDTIKKKKKANIKFCGFSRRKGFLKDRKVSSSFLFHFRFCAAGRRLDTIQPTSCYVTFS